MKKIIRVFPRKTKATPNDELVRIGCEPDLFDEADEIHVDCTFTWDLPFAERLAKVWRSVADVKLGGVACGTKGEEFVSGMYLKKGYTITSRGCPNKCWFCSVWKRDGNIRELPIVDGWNILDDNILACSETHIRNVFAMLKKQKRKAEFTGGLEAKRLLPWHVELLSDLRPKQMFFAYDTEDDLEPLIQAGKILQEAGFTLKKRITRCYVLCGYRGDSFELAEKRMIQTIKAGFMPMAMAYSINGQIDKEWKKFQRAWARPAIMHRKIKQIVIDNK